MDQLSIFVGVSTDTEEIRHQLANVFDLRFLQLSQIRNMAPEPYLVFDINMHDGPYLIEIQEWLKKKPKGGKVIFVIDKDLRAEKIQALALGATDVIHRPINGRALLSILWGDFDALALDRSHRQFTNIPAVGTTFDALENVFSSACLGASLDLQKVHSAGEALVNYIETQGLGSLIEAVRKHHSLTYQHSLLVAGVAVAFGQHLGISKKERQRLSFAGMLHDIGKARIPVSILEKPGPLDNDEMAVLRKHPEYGFEALDSIPGIPKEMSDVVIHHHEYLDGSGYPHGLQANEISDLVRIMTISDVFGALIERRSYKPPMSGKDAYQIVLNMGPKLDKALVREFRFASGLQVAA